ncbi:hypothetical protein PDIP_87550 [Penicillium digitatum Pd1]|uniref:Reverse transcriptase Ty1/copia-type domain-containing protein n=1 Tax=Penicillium digitatum (strain Pd1 / CECT 20795) TaxID=1170230 RepID=K9F5V1_PEND1|nr:hypothetical protein PDIP_87550 [Penicillium digitatum Pd1]EKV04384.1 hypothetical protein PDIP_87550 [Penicillium digitatum Pd1]
MQASYNIEDFTINSHEIDISSAVPKLEGQSNFRDWETALYIALAANNRYYTFMISNGIPIPRIPEYQDSSPEAVRNLLNEEAQDLAGDQTTTVVISVAEIRDRVKQVIESNIVLRKEYNLKCTNRDLCNSRANLLLRGTLSPEPFFHIAQNTDVRDSFKKLRATYAVTSHQHSFARYTKWTDLRLKNGTASEFVRKFQETLRDLTSIDGKINSAYVPCQFKKAINENPKCYAFLQNLRVDEKDVNLMDQVYAEFLEVDIHNRSMNRHPDLNPSDVHFQALKRVFRYLTGTKLLTISFYPSMQDAAVCGYCDADWAGPHSEKGLSTSGFLFKMAGGAISWTSKKQPCVALSTTESEYIAESLAVQEAIWLTQLLTELGIEGFLRKPIPIYADNNGAIALASNPEFHSAMKLIAIRFHRLREEVAAGNVKFVKIPTADMAADGLKKPLGKTLFKRWIIQMGLTVYKIALNG